MARTIKEIQQQIIDQKNSYAELSEVNSDSKMAVWRLWSYIVAVVHWTLESLFDQHKKEVNTDLKNLKPHGEKWYYNKALDFQYGHQLADNGEADYYDNTNRTDEEVEEAKIIAACAVNDQKDLQIKVAKENDQGNLTQLTTTEKDAFTLYMETIQDAGVYLDIVNRPADKLKLGFDIYYDPLVLDENGLPISGGSDEPVRLAIKEYLRNLPFDGTLVLASLIDKLQAVEGVEIPHLTEAQKEKDGGGFETLQVKHTPFAGYFSTVADDGTDLITINYIANE